MDHQDTSRRRFLQSLGGSAGALWLGANWPQVVAAAEHAHEAAATPIDHGFKVLTPGQARDVAAIAAQIVPSGVTPGAREAGVVYFVDHIHAGLYASRAREFLEGLGAFQRDFATAHPVPGQFADLPEDAQLEYLKSVEKTPFFARMRFLTVLGLLALPAYGGNENKLGWKLAGFVDRHVWSPPFGYYDAGYTGFEPYLPPERRS